MREEKDFLGSRELPEEVRYGIHTLRALENFGDSGEKTDPLFIRAYLEVKKAAALTNRDLGTLDSVKAGFILEAIESLLHSNTPDQDFPVNPLSGGGRNVLPYEY